MNKFLPFLLTFLYYITTVFSVTLEELKPLYYGVDISKIPVKRGVKQLMPYIPMTSKYGQVYQCLLPQIREEEIGPDKDPLAEKEVDIKNLLKPFKHSCLLKNKDWWTYELCFNKHIKQYHIEDGQIVGNVMTLGYFDSEYDWSNETDIHVKFKNAKQKYHSQLYTNGSKCDLTGLPRQTEVRLFCEEDSVDFILRVDEPGTCNYLFIVNTARLCSHPQLKPPPAKKGYAIICHPELEVEKYDKYLIKFNKRKELEEKKKADFMKEQQERLKEMKEGKLKHPILDPTGDILKSIASGTVKDTSELLNVINSQEAKIEKQHLRSFDEENVISSEDLGLLFEDRELPEQFFAAIPEKPRKQPPKESYESKVSSTKPKPLESKPSEAKPSEPKPAKDIVSVKPELLAVEQSLYETFDTELETLRKLDLSDRFSTKKSAIQDHFDTILSQAESEEENEESDQVKEKIFVRLTSMLDVLLQRLDKSDIAEWKKFVLLKELQQAERKVAKAMNDFKLSRLSRKRMKDKQMKSGLLDGDLKPGAASGQEMSDEDRVKLESAIKDRLEKAGFDGGGRKIEVKILSSDSLTSGKEKGGMFSLTDAEANEFQNMILALLTNQQDKVHEEERQKSLENGYNMSWDEEIEDKENKEK